MQKLKVDRLDKLAGQNEKCDLSLPAQLLTDWFAVHARKLPWREDFKEKSLYRVLVSEFMLQQTRVETVIPYFERWISRWPDLASFSNANEDEALKLWEGLGYYSRCRNLLKSARALHAHLSNSESEVITLEMLRTCPGIGEYTAGAIASIGLGLPVPAVDGNAERVIGRFAALALSVGSTALRREVSNIVTSMLKHANAGIFNQALMDLGSLVCTPRSPNCDVCPWTEICQAHIMAHKGQAQVTDFPLPRVRPVISNDNAWGLVIFRNTCSCDKNSKNELEILLHRRPSSGLWAGMWEIPWCNRTDASFKTDFTAWCSSLNSDTNFTGLSDAASNLDVLTELGAVTFSFTTHRVRAWVVALDMSGIITGDLDSCKDWRFAPLKTQVSKAGEPGIDTMTLPAPSRKFLALFTKNLKNLAESCIFSRANI